MLETLIASESLDVREKSYVDKNRIVIPVNKRKKDVKKLLKSKLGPKTYTDERLYYESLSVEKPEKKSINELVLGIGR